MPEQEETIPGQLAEIRSRLDKSDQRFEKLEALVAENTEITKDIRDALTAGRVATKVVKWLGGLALGTSAIWAAWHQVSNGGQPPIPPIK